jgi:hypothetical protein
MERNGIQMEIVMDDVNNFTFTSTKDQMVCGNTIMKG